MKGPALLNDVNEIRACLGKAPIARISLEGMHPHDPNYCAAALSTGALVASSTYPEWSHRFALRFSDMATTQAVGAALGQPVASDRPEVLAPDPGESLVIAVHFGLFFETPDGFLKGWIEPTEDDASVWDLHLMPGELYPAGHAPAELRGRESALDQAVPAAAGAPCATSLLPTAVEPVP
jgi:hypothetical protein